MSGLFALGVQDFKRLLTNALFWIITATLVAILLVIHFALPENVSEEGHSLFVYPETLLVPGATAAGSEAELRQAVMTEGGIGLLGSADGGITVIHPGLSEKTVRAIMTVLNAPSEVPVEVESLVENSPTLPFNLRMTPLFICFEALVTGFILGGALMLSEREEGTVRALRVSPMGVDRYLIAKTTLFSVLATVYALLMAFWTVGFGFSILRFALLSFFGAAVFTLIGLAFTTLFRDMSSWFFTMALLLSINMLPAMSYADPSFSPAWIRALPSYSIIFAYEKILFGLGGDLLPVALVVACWCLGAYILSRIAVGRLFLAKRG